MSYTRRTCDECGYRDIQPNMIIHTKMVPTGKSQSGTSTMTWIGALGGHKPSVRAIQRQVFNTSKRNYFREKKVWLCKICSEKQNNAENFSENAKEEKSKKLNHLLHFILSIFTGIGLIIYLFLA